MATPSSTRRYAQAAFEVADEHNELDLWAKELETVAARLANEDFLALLDAPQVPIAAKLNGVRIVLQDVSPRVRNFVSVLVQQRQARSFNAMRDEFRRLADERRGIARAVVTTAVPLDEERRRRVTDQLGQLVGKKIVLTERVDPSIIGGVVARAGDKLIDGSMKTRLSQLRNSLAVKPG